MPKAKPLYKRYWIQKHIAHEKLIRLVRVMHHLAQIHPFLMTVMKQDVKIRRSLQASWTGSLQFK